MSQRLPSDTPFIETGLPRTFLLPGEAKFSREPHIISTLLGSCVAVCLHDREKQFGGMNHYMLDVFRPTTRFTDGKFGDRAIAGLLRVAEHSGVRPGALVASVYGGAAVVGPAMPSQAEEAGGIGHANIAVAHALLRKAGIPIVAENTGGQLGRKIHMNTATNEIVVEQINRRDIEDRAAAPRGGRTKVLIVDDSSTVRYLIRGVIESAPDLEVAGEAADPYEARELILATDPGVLCLDIIMPRMDGHTFLKRIMRYKPIPTVVVSTVAQRGSTMRSNVLAAGAVAVIDKNELELYKDPQRAAKILLPCLRRAAGTRVIRRD